MKTITCVFLLFIFSPLEMVLGQNMEVRGRFLYDPCGEKVILKGSNTYIAFWDRDGIPTFQELAKTGANCARIFWRTNGGKENVIPPSDLDEAIRNCIGQEMIPMPCVWDATGDSLNSEEFRRCVDYWLRPEMLKIIKKHEAYLLLNIANEVNAASDEDYREGYRKTVWRLREAGIRVPLVIDAAHWGRNEQFILNNARYLIEHDPEHNLIFSWHPWDNSTSEERIKNGIDRSIEKDICMIIGEFSWTDVFHKPYETPSIWKFIIEYAGKNQIGWLPWIWGPPGGNGKG